MGVFLRLANGFRDIFRAMAVCNGSHRRLCSAVLPQQSKPAVVSASLDSLQDLDIVSTIRTRTDTATLDTFSRSCSSFPSCPIPRTLL
jgi:hypothetical protein